MSVYDSISPRDAVEKMTEIDREKISRMIEAQRAASMADKNEARASLMRSGLYNADGSLKAVYGGKKKTAAY